MPKFIDLTGKIFGRCCMKIGRLLKDECETYNRR